MTRKKSTELLIPEKPIITLSDEQFRRLEEIESTKRPNPFPWVVIGLTLILLAVVGGMGLVVAILKPTPAPIQTQIIVIPARETNTPIPPTKTLTPTFTPTHTPDMTATFVSAPAWQVIRDYIDYAMRADFGSAWNCLSQRCRNRECWESWQGDFLAFKEWWRSWGRMEIRKLTPEFMNSFDAQAFITLYFYKDELPHDYRFYLRKVEGSWKIDRIEYVALMK